MLLPRVARLLAPPWSPARCSHCAHTPDLASAAPGLRRPRPRQQGHGGSPLAAGLRARQHSSMSSALRQSRSPPEVPVEPRLFGQPVASTHPHLLKPDEITVGISAAEYEGRRKALMSMLEPGAVVVVAGGRVKWMAHHVFYKFRQASDFWYLTGWEEPDSVLVMEKDNSKRGYRMTMLVPANDPEWELWNGPRTGLEGARDIFGADEAVGVSKLATFLRPLLTGPSSSQVYLDLPTDVPLPPAAKRPSASFTSNASGRPASTLLDHLSPAFSSLGDLAHLATSLHRGPKADLDACLAALYPRSTRARLPAARPLAELRPHVDHLRVLKSPAELCLLRRAADTSSRAHAAAMRLASRRPALTEHDLVAAFEASCAARGSLRPAYVPVCAGAGAALMIHYTANDARLRPGSMVLLDAGCEHAGYASDITRTFPVSPGDLRGRFTSPQRDLYSAVLEVQKDLIRWCAAAAGSPSPSLSSLHRRSCELLRRELKHLGFEMKAGELEKVYPHYVGHPLGVDLHDTPSFDRTSPLRENMVITIEPGVYVPDLPSFPKHFRGMGIRIEDEVLVTADGPVVLSVNAPKEVADVEACCSGLLEGVLEEAASQSRDSL